MGILRSFWNQVGNDDMAWLFGAVGAAILAGALHLLHAPMGVGTIVVLLWVAVIGACWRAAGR